MYEDKISEFINQVLFTAPLAYTDVRGGSRFPDIRGMIYFYEVYRGTLILAEVWGLPHAEGPCPGRFFGFHIHEGGSCLGSDGEDPFAGTKGHLNPGDCSHPEHTGDLPMLLGNRGFAWMACYTERFVPGSILGHTAVIHELLDDFRTQPSGNSGEKIACGVIMPYAMAAGVDFNSVNR